MHRFLTALGWTIASILLGMLGVDIPPLPEDEQDKKRKSPGKKSQA